MTNCLFSALAKEASEGWTLKHRSGAGHALHNYEPSLHLSAHPVFREVSTRVHVQHAVKSEYKDLASVPMALFRYRKSRLKLAIFRAFCSDFCGVFSVRFDTMHVTLSGVRGSAA